MNDNSKKYIRVCQHPFCKVKVNFLFHGDDNPSMFERFLRFVGIVYTIDVTDIIDKNKKIV